jgi:hypothetical protein
VGGEAHILRRQPDMFTETKWPSNNQPRQDTMKNTKALLLRLFVLSLQFSLCYSQGKDGLVAAPYPGSITEPPVVPSRSSQQKSYNKESNRRTFYTKDPIEKVLAHYTKSLGAFEKTSQDNTTYFREAIPSNDVMEYLAKQGVEMGESRVYAGITLSGKGFSPSNTVTKVLDKLKSAYLMRFKDDEVQDLSTISKHLEEPELKQTIARYEHIGWEYFPLAKEKHMDEVIFEKYLVAPEEAATKEEQELVKKMMELTTHGKYDDAMKISDRMTKLSSRHSDARGNWGNAIKCLQEMEKNAYATQIVIDKHPSQWDLSTWK